MKKLYKPATIWGLIALLVATTTIFILTGCKKEPAVYKIGAILPLTGPAADIGGWQKNGLDLAIQAINAKGGIKGKKVEIIYEDSKGDPKEGVAIFNKMASVQKLPVVFSCLSSVSAALIPITDKNKINLMMLAVSLPGIADRSMWAFRCNVGSDDEAKEMAEFLVEKKHLRKLAVLYINDEFGLGAYKVFKEIFETGGGKIVWSETYEKDATDLRSQLSKLKTVDSEGTYVIGYVKASVIAMKQLREIGIRTPIFANMALTVPVFVELAGDAAEGAHFTTNLFDPDSKDPRVVKFADNYKSQYGSPPNFFVAFAYDAMRMVLKSIEEKGYTNEDIRNGLLSIKSFPGVMGDIDILPNGDMKFPVRIVKIEKGRVREVSR